MIKCIEMWESIDNHLDVQKVGKLSRRVLIGQKRWPRRTGMLRSPRMTVDVTQLSNVEMSIYRA